MPPDPFTLDELPAPARWLVDRMLALAAYRRLYREVRSGPHADISDHPPFERRVLNALHIGVEAAPADLSVIPARGPLVVASNHPHGIVDGLALMSLLRTVRPDVRILTNRLLARIPELREFCFFVDPFDGPAATARSYEGLRAAHLWLRRGGALIVFPAGEVAHGPLLDGCHADSPWQPTMARLARAAGATILPVHIDGTNSRLFYAAGRLHPALRTALLPREFLKKRGATIAIRVGASTMIADEIENLPGEACLVESGAFQVFCADAAQIPSTLREIGRLREIAYRAVGEGTGRVLDLDAFDERYRHLFLWDREQRRVAGAYRLGEADEIVASCGVEGLYTRTLFRYDEELLTRLGGPALELGRSFVRQEYQRNYSALLMLWRGIGQFVVRHPRYRFLFGPVSVSAHYSDTSHGLLIEFLRQNHFAADLAAVVEAINPCASRPAPDAGRLAPQTLDEVDGLVARAEHDGKGVPVLLRQYLKLNARLIGLNLDPTFGGALDALMVVDLTTVDPAVLTRYLGRRDAEGFVAFHRARFRTRAA